VHWAVAEGITRAIANGYIAGYADAPRAAGGRWCTGCIVCLPFVIMLDVGGESPQAIEAERTQYMRLRQREETVAWLRRVPLLAHLSTAQLESVAPYVDEVETTAGQVLIDQDGFGQELLIIIDGTVEVTRDGRRLRDLGAGEIIGEIALLDGGPNMATVTTREPTTVLSINKRALDTVLDHVPGLPHELLRALARRLREATAALDAD
jgi:hypothetical protein